MDFLVVVEENRWEHREFTAATPWTWIHSPVLTEAASPEPTTACRALQWLGMETVKDFPARDSDRQFQGAENHLSVRLLGFIFSPCANNFLSGLFYRQKHMLLYKVK